MSDKLRRTFPLSITVTDGEQPSSAKLTAIAQQARNALGIVELAIGDPWNQAGDPILTNVPLQIPNLARLIGENKYLNPALYPTENDFYFVEDLSDFHRGETEFYLLFKPKDLTNFTVSSDPFSHLVTRKDNAYEVTTDGDYYVDSTTGRMVVAKPIPSLTPVIRYEVSPSTDWIKQKHVLPGVIPDPRQEDYAGCRIENSGGTFLLHLPPRQPLNLDAIEKPYNYPTGVQVTDNLATTLDVASRRLWQSSGVNAFADAHYRYGFPKEIQDIIASLATGEVLPAGFLYLWNQAGRTIVSDVVFKKSTTGQAWTLEIESDSLDLSSIATGDESSTSYNSGYSLICVGAPLARSIWQLRSMIEQGAHDNSGDFTALIDHSDLTNQNPPVDDTGNDHFGRYPTYLGFWPNSRWTGDSHTSLLSRAGSQGIGSRNRDIYDDAMLGDLLLANADRSGGQNFIDQDVPDGSFGIFFGSRDSRAKMWSPRPNDIATSGNFYSYGDVVGVGIDGAMWHGKAISSAGSFVKQEPLFTLYGSVSGIQNGYFGSIPLRYEQELYTLSTFATDCYKWNINSQTVSGLEFISLESSEGFSGSGQGQDLISMDDYLFALLSPSSSGVDDYLVKVKIRNDNKGSIFEASTSGAIPSPNTNSRRMTLHHINGLPRVYIVGAQSGGTGFLSCFDAHQESASLDSAPLFTRTLVSDTATYYWASDIIALQNYLYVVAQSAVTANTAPVLLKISPADGAIISAITLAGNGFNPLTNQQTQPACITTNGRDLYIAWNDSSNGPASVKIIANDHSTTAPTSPGNDAELLSGAAVGDLVVGITAIGSWSYILVADVSALTLSLYTALINTNSAQPAYSLMRDLGQYDSGHEFASRLISDGKYLWATSGRTTGSNESTIHKVLISS